MNNKLDNVVYYFNNECTPAEFSQVMDDAYFLITQMALSDVTSIPRGELEVGDVLWNLHQFKKALQKA